VRRVAAIVAADLRIRFRRASTAVVFLLLSALAYVWVPDPASGNTLLVLEGRRALYNSAAIALGTASLATIFIGLVGFYVISNAVRRDVVSRCGFVIASTTMRGSEYLFGKFAGNVVFLSTFMVGFMLSSMAMLLVRGEAPLQPLVFMWQYALLVPPAVMFVSGLALLFESIAFLSGKFGDVLYFFVWVASVGVIAAMHDGKTGVGWAAYFDFTGFGFLLDTLRRTLNSTSVSLGHTNYDMTKSVFVFSGLRLAPEWVMPRIVATLSPILLVFTALPFFHRFDPARVKAAAQKSGRNWLSRIGMLGKPLTRVLAIGGGPARTDAFMTVASSPGILLIAIVLAIASVTVDVLPIAVAAAAVLIADISCREKRAGTTALVFTTPRIKTGFVLWKFASAVIVASIVLIVPALRAMNAYVVVGILFIAGVSTLLGVVSANPKTFIVLFLTFWYIVVNDKGKTAALDFAGFGGVATPEVAVSYLVVSMVALAGAEAFHRIDLRRNW
jgi:hypothetical protein